ncbi:putative ubiE/COQ5 methyltransferase [Polyplosphaeria fusca]|uniref:UbiE/COQ5 methyltransferase n=1 Tax=Polyplosphaeria fusca TaxID=682080 RepID=A0A9P4RAT6_9PLEO|nr:putative ubiE/COQ5 methyltransferase [Polyplosphaeria fusca]
MAQAQVSNYKQGHDRAVTRAHAQRTTEVEGAFVVPHLKPHFKILDVGCGPGSITAGFAKYVPEGSVTGVDLSEQVLDQAREHLSEQDANASNVTFELGNVLDGLQYEDESFDVVFCNQTLLHIPEIIKALTEIKRVIRPGGFLAARESDLPFRWYPYLPGLQLLDKYLYELTITRTDRKHPMNPPHAPGHRGGGVVHVFAREAGFDPAKMKKGAGTQCYGTSEETLWFADIMTGRMKVHRESYSELGATEEELKMMEDDLKMWGEHVDAWFAILQAELICWV